MRNLRPRDKHYSSKVYHRRVRSRNMSYVTTRTVPNYVPISIPYECPYEFGGSYGHSSKYNSKHAWLRIWFIIAGLFTNKGWRYRFYDNKEPERSATIHGYASILPVGAMVCTRIRNKVVWIRKGYYNNWTAVSKRTKLR